jgi:hypothetical protein
MSTPAHDLRTALLLGLGLALTGCLDKEEDDDAGDDTSTSPSDDTSSPTQTLDPLPDGDYPECEGGDSGLAGPCCVDVYCLQPGADGTCRASSDVSAEELTGLGLGSGDCQCSPVEGPYAPRPTDAEACCYLVGVQWCTGRPIFVAGRTGRARAVTGRRWSA